jgi:magnesium-transporting ATPase (P-type)
MTSMSFDIEPKELMKIMSNYKSRTSEREDIKYFKQNNISDILSKLKTDPEKGISSKENREEFFGSNKIFNEPPPSFFRFVLGSLNNLMIYILLVAAIASIILSCTISTNKKSDWIDGVSILVAVLIVVLVSSITEYSKEKKFHELNKTNNEQTKYKIIRKGQPDEYISDNILVGDLIMINQGDIMSSDILLIKGTGIKMDESALTGESETMKKEPYEKCLQLLENSNEKDIIPSPLILSGTNCIGGTGKGIVLAVGEHSQKGIIKRTIDNAKENNKTPLEIKLDKIARVIGYIGLFVGIATTSKL